MPTAPIHLMSLAVNVDTTSSRVTALVIEGALLFTDAWRSTN